jgi:hypothetical protein
VCKRAWKVCENFKGPMEMVERDHYIQCVGLKILLLLLFYFLLFFVIAGFGGLNLFVFRYLE